MNIEILNLSILNLCDFASLRDFSFHPTQSCKIRYYALTEYLK
jgi:hypothetical protein